ncbi:MAG: RNA 3'-terminal phosphate cyclase [Gammaproteobacteria bacterium]|nr:RNA 3'-terminal phosphate cyclase [Gammaproteobacteria bacterium]
MPQTPVPLAMLVLDGSHGEGGGQILRSSLSLAICTQQAFRIENLRANRKPPGLQRQHLAAVRAATQISDAEVSGDEIGSQTLVFKPGKVRPGSYTFAIGTAGSATLVLQTVLPPLLSAQRPSTVRVTGGTHNRGAPPFDFLARTFVPQLARMGAQVELELLAYGFYPRGGGEIRAEIQPAALQPLHLHERGELRRGYADAYVAGLPMHIAERELKVIGRVLGWSQDRLNVRVLPNDMGPGNAVTITIEYEHVAEVITGFGERGVRAETLAQAAALEAREYLRARAPVGAHLADQLLVPMTLAGGGSFTTTAVTPHLESNALVVETFTGRRIRIEPHQEGFRVEC